MPTVSSCGAFRSGSGIGSLSRKLHKMYGADDAKVIVGTPLKTNPELLEFTMGWPIGWTSLEDIKELKIVEWTDNNAKKFSPISDVKFQKERIKAIGNGQVPLCVYEILRNFIEEYL